jgi:heme/copper-type cytochrome/quinol oxidase subunit 2
VGLSSLSRAENGSRIETWVMVAILFLVAVPGSYWYGTRVSTVTQTQPTSQVVQLDIIADWGGNTVDAFVLSSALNGTNPTPANTIIVKANVPVTFIITSLDSAVNQNFNGTVSVPFTLYNDTGSAQVAVHYVIGQSISNIPVGHSFTVPAFGINIPNPPNSVVTFTYTFTKPGTYSYYCTVPCGAGMDKIGYMMGSIVVQGS